MLPDYFSERVLKHPGRGCWEWQGPLNNKGYGMMYVREFGRRSTSHRASYEFHFGPIPQGLWVLHKCDNPKCLRPSHLFLGTPTDNVRDMDQKKRRNSANQPRGEDNSNARMTAASVVALREMYVAHATRAEIAATFGISELSVSDYVLGRSWTHIADGPSKEQMARETERRRKVGAKITKEIAYEIRRRIAAGEMSRDLAREFGLSSATVSEIKLFKIWR